MLRHARIGAACLLLLLSLGACTPTAPTTYIEETIDVPWGSLAGGARRHTYEFDISADGFFEITIESWTWDDNDVFEIELRDAATGEMLLEHRSCDAWAKGAGAACDSLAHQLPSTFGARVAGGRRVLMRVYHEKGSLGFRLRVKRPR